MLQLQSIPQWIARQSRKLLALLRIRYVEGKPFHAVVDDNTPKFPRTEETAAEDCRNALTILQLAYVTHAGTVELTQPELRAISERLTRAVRKLETSMTVRAAAALTAAAELEQIHRPLLTRTTRTRKDDLEHQRRDAWARWLGEASLHS